MRPINIVSPPLDANGNPKTVEDYKDFRRDLLDAYGQYCVYCNMRLTHDIHIDHIKPKIKFSHLKTTWENLLPACGPCNRAKSDEELNDCYAPHIHNTHLAFDAVLKQIQLPSGELAPVPQPSRHLTPEEKAKVEKIIEILNLSHRRTEKKQIERASDLRWQERKKAIAHARVWRGKWDNPREEFDLELFAISVADSGFFSIWYNAFLGVPEALAVIVEAFPGTCPVSFDKTNNYAPLRRNPPDL